MTIKQTDGAKVTFAAQDVRAGSPAAEPVRIWKGGQEAANAVAPGQSYIDADGTLRVRPLPPKPVIARKRVIGVSSRALQFAPTLEDVVTLARAAGFDAIEWNVSEGGHIAPANVARDLPRAVALTKAAGMTVQIIDTGIQDAKSPYAEAILKAMKAQGIVHYRSSNYFKYDMSRDDILAQLEAIGARMKTLAPLNAKYGTKVGFHTHEGFDEVGGTVWDFWTILKDIPPGSIGIDYDLACATWRDSYTGWLDAAYMTGDWVQSLSIKDFLWQAAPGEFVDGLANWKRQAMPIGDGMVDVRHFLEFYGRRDFQGPITLYYEHSGLSGGPVGSYRGPGDAKAVVALLKTDLDYVRAVMLEAKFSLPA